MTISKFIKKAIISIHQLPWLSSRVGWPSWFWWCLQNKLCISSSITTISEPWLTWWRERSTRSMNSCSSSSLPSCLCPQSLSPQVLMLSFSAMAWMVDVMTPDKEGLHQRNLKQFLLNQRSENLWARIILWSSITFTPSGTLSDKQLNHAIHTGWTLSMKKITPILRQKTTLTFILLESWELSFGFYGSS